MYWNGVPGIWVLLPQTEPLSGARSVQLRDAERLRLPPCDGERNSKDQQRKQWAKNNKGSLIKNKNKNKKVINKADMNEKQKQK